MEAILIGNVIVTAIVMLYLSIYMPLLYKFGVTKGRYLSLFALAMFVAMMIGDFIHYVPYLILPAGVFGYWLSHLCACHIYERLDF